MATLYQRGDSYYLQYYDRATKKQRRESLGRISAADAETARAAKEYELSPKGRSLGHSTLLFGQFLDHYLTLRESEFPDSHIRVDQICHDAFGEFLSKPISSITTDDVKRWLATRRSRVTLNRHKQKALASSETVAKELRTLKAVFNAAVESGYLPSSPAKPVTPPKNKRSAPVHFYTKGELSTLYGEGVELAPVWRLLANTGMRRAEAQHLKWADVNLEDGVINVLSTDDERTKSGKWRQIPLSEGARESLHLLAMVTGESQYVVPRMTGPSLSRAFLRDCKRLGLKGSLHSLRHTYGAHLVMAGVPLRTVQHLMGHQSFVTTERYAHVGKDHLREQAALVSL